MTTTLVGRDEELGRVHAFLERASDGPAALVVSGRPGIGKTALLESALEHATSQRVLLHRAVEAEASIGLATLSDLFLSPFLEAADDLPAPRRRALEVALLLSEAPESFVVDTRLLGLGVLDVLRSLAERRPVVLAIDDLQWVDRSSAEAIRFAIRRLQDERVAVIATVRVDWSDARATPATVLPGVRVEHIELGPLSIDAVYRLLSDSTELRLSRPKLLELYERVDGNPLFALELARELESPPGLDRALPATLVESLANRLGQVPPDSLAVLLVAAALRVADADTLGRALGEDRTRAALEVAASLGLVRLHGGVVRFVHPLIPAVALDTSLPWQRRHAHAAAARITSDPEERARQLARAAEGPDESVAEELERAARRADRRGATAEAASLAELAIELTADSSRLTGRLLAAADLDRRSGDRHRAVELARAVLDHGAQGNERADALFTLAQCRTSDLPAIVSLCNEALASASADSRRLASIHAFASWMQILVGDVPNALAHGRSALEHAERTGDRRLVARAIARVAMAETWSLEETPGLLERGVEIERTLLQPLEYHGSPRIALARRLICVQRLDGAHTLLEEAEAAAASVGDDATRAHLLFHEAQLENDRARWHAAVERADLGLDLAGQLEDPQLRGMLLNVKSYAHALLGDVDEARAAAEEGLAIASRVGDALFDVQHWDVLGLIALSLGETEEAARHLADLPDRLVSLGMLEASDIAWPAAIEALVEVGELVRAEDYLERFEDMAVRARGPWALASAARCRALLAAAAGDEEGATASFERALLEHARMDRPFDEAWTLFCLGRVARRFRRKGDAREALERARAVFEAVGARLWSARAEAELARIAGRRRADGALTEAETQTARLAAQGYSNKQIAAQLFVSVHTVESHLSSVYRKLDITSRYALAARLDELAPGTAAEREPR
jgi:DNA-binding CsgD family transcriptional regulator